MVTFRDPPRHALALRTKAPRSVPSAALAVAAVLVCAAAAGEPSRAAPASPAPSASAGAATPHAAPAPPAPAPPAEAAPAAPPPGDAKAPVEGASLPAAVASQPIPERKIALTVSGGISLGSYEAGLNWALLQLIRASRADRAAFPQTMDLVGMTGASAGNINAFLGAVEWCSEAPLADGAATSNLFWDAWIPIGIDQLFPGDRSCEEYAGSIGNPASFSCKDGNEPYGKDDGVFSRRAFTNILERLRKRIDGGKQFRPGCRFPVGVTVTKAVPAPVEGERFRDLDVRTQRFSVLLNASVENGRLVFEQPTPSAGRLVGNRIYLPEEGGRVTTEAVLKVIQASSAFPAAFGPMVLDYCMAGDLVEGSCKQAKQSDVFLDGGLFDNLPIGLALQSFSSVTAGRDQEHVLMYLNPERRRNLEGTVLEAQDVEPPPATSGDRKGVERGYKYLMSLVGRFITVARTYELQSTIRYDDGADLAVKTDATSRFSPIFGGYLGAFAGFLAQPLREYDYYAGVYDALFHVASLECAAPARPQAPAGVGRGDCLLREVNRYRALLHLGEKSPASFVVSHQLRAELPAVVGPLAWQDFARRHQAEIDALDRATTADDVLAALHSAIAAARSAQALSGGEPTFDWLLDHIHVTEKLLDHRRDAAGKPAPVRGSERALFVNPRSLLGSLARQIAQRLVDIEDEEADSSGDGVMGLAQFATETYFNGREYENRFVWAPSTVPDGAGWAARLLTGMLPYYATVHVPEGGAQLGYLPTWYWGNGWGLAFPVSPFAWKRTKESRESFELRGGASLAWTPSSNLLSRFELGLTAAYGYRSPLPVGDAGRARFGGQFAGQLLLNRFRFAVDVDSTTEGDVAVSGQLGLADLNGIVYWLVRAIGD